MIKFFSQLAWSKQISLGIGIRQIIQVEFYPDNYPGCVKISNVVLKMDKFLKGRARYVNFSAKNFSGLSWSKQIFPGLIYFSRV